MIVGGIPMMLGGGVPITSIGTLGTGNSITSGTTLGLTTTAEALAGSIIILAIAKDNVSTTNGNTSEVSSIADSSGNTWAKLREYCNGGGAAAAGTTVSVWKCKVSTTIASAGTITATFASAITAKAMSAWNFNNAGTLEIAGTPVDSTSNSEAAALTLSGLPSKEYLFLRCTAMETNQSGYTPTASFTAISNAITAGLPNSSSQAAQGEFRILTSTSVSSQPVDNGNEVAHMLFALESV